MVYKAAIIGCHGVGKTTLAKKLEEEGYEIFHEAPINEFQGKHPFLAEVRIITDNIMINKRIKEANDSEGISDRFGFLNPLIYGEAMRRLNWISEEQLRNIYEIVNHAEHEWHYPEKLLCMHDDKEVILYNIKNRNREGLKEDNQEYLNTVWKLYHEFYNNELEFKYLKPELRKRLEDIPKKVIKSRAEINDVLELLD